ncbi:MAG: DUF4491 family protein [Bacteroidales bacterium OttesenSCG-928-I14]|jgi:hypothetical protein|nr:DUF4491 family protein [Bacteroidales bacterium OttesenSCG-928-I14]
MVQLLVFHTNIKGLSLGLFTFIIIWIFHPLVIKIEYYFKNKSWYVFLITTIVNAFISTRIQDVFISSMFGVLAFVSFWSIFETFKQTKRVKNRALLQEKKRPH